MSPKAFKNAVHLLEIHLCLNVIFTGCINAASYWRLEKNILSEFKDLKKENKELKDELDNHKIHFI